MPSIELPPDKKRQKKIKQEIEENLEVGPGLLSRQTARIVAFDQTLRLSGLIDDRVSKLKELDGVNKDIAEERVKERQKTGNDTNAKIKKLEAKRAQKQAELKKVEDAIQKVSDHLKKAEYFLTGKLDVSIAAARQRLEQLRTMEKTAQANEEQVKKTFASINDQIAALKRTVPLSAEQRQDLVALDEQRQELIAWEKEWLKAQKDIDKTINGIEESIKDKEKIAKAAHAACNPQEMLQKTADQASTEFSMDDAKKFFEKNIGGTMWEYVDKELRAMQKEGVYSGQVKRLLRFMKDQRVVGIAGVVGGTLFERFMEKLNEQDARALATAFSRMSGGDLNIKGKNPLESPKKTEATVMSSFAEERKEQSEAFRKEIADLINHPTDAKMERLKTILEANRSNIPFWQEVVHDLKNDLMGDPNRSIRIPMSSETDLSMYDLIATLQALGYVHKAYEYLEDRDDANNPAVPNDIAQFSSPAELAKALAEPNTAKLLARMNTDYVTYNPDEPYEILRIFLSKHNAESHFDALLMQPAEERLDDERVQDFFEKQSQWLTKEELLELSELLAANTEASTFWRDVVNLAYNEHDASLGGDLAGHGITPGAESVEEQNQTEQDIRRQLGELPAQKQDIQRQLESVEGKLREFSEMEFSNKELKATARDQQGIDGLESQRRALVDRLDLLNGQEQELTNQLSTVTAKLKSGHVIVKHEKYKGDVSLDGVMEAFRILGLLNENAPEEFTFANPVPARDDIDKLMRNPRRESLLRSLHWFIGRSHLYEELSVHHAEFKKKALEEPTLKELVLPGLAALSYGVAGKIIDVQDKFAAMRELPARQELESIARLTSGIESRRADTHEAINERRRELERARIACRKLLEYTQTLPDERARKIEPDIDTLRMHVDELADTFENAYYQSLADAIGERLKVVATDIATANLRDPISEKEVHDAQKGVEESVKQFDELSEQHDRRLSMIPDNPDHAAERKTAGDMLDVAHDNITTVWNDALALESHFVSENLDTLRGEVESGLPDSKVEAVKMAQRIGQGFLRVKRFSDDVERRKDSDIFQGLDMDRAIEETRFQEEIDEIGTEYVQLLKQAGTRFGNDVIESLSGFTAPIDAYQYRWLGLDKKPDSGDDARLVAAKPDDRPPRPSGKPKRGKTLEEITKNIECPPEVRERIIDRLIHSLNERGFSGSFPKDVRGILVAESGEVADTGVAFSILELSDIADELMQANFGRHYERYNSDNPEHRLVAAYMRANLSAWMDEAERMIKADEENEIDISDLLNESLEVSATPQQVDEIVSLFAEKGFETSPERSDYINVLNALKNNDFRPLGEILWKVFEILTGKSRDQLVKTENRDLLAHTAQYLLESEGDSNPARIVEWIIAAREKQKTPMASFDEKIAKRFQERISVSFPATVLISGPKDPSLRFSTFTDNLHNILREILNTCGSVKVVTEPTFRTKEGDHENEASFTNLEVKNIPYGPMGLLKISATFTGKIGVERETSGQIYVHLMVDPVEIHAPFNLGDSITPAEISDALFKNLYNTDARQKLARYLDTL